MAQNSILPMGARANAMGYSSVCLRDEWSVFNNPGDLGRVESFSASVTYDHLSGFPSFNRMAMVVSMPWKSAGIGAAFFRFGDDLFSEQMLSAGYGNTIGNTSLGIRANLIQYKIGEFGQKNLATISFGGVSTLTRWLTVGGYIHNINQPEIGEGERVPTSMTTGMMARLSDKVIILADAEKKIRFPVTVRAGVEYTIHPVVTVRTGFTIKPNAGFFGFGLRKKKVRFDYAYSWIPSFASRHQWSFHYLLPAQK